MIELFEDYDPNRKYPIQTVSSMDYILRSYQRDVSEVILYYRGGIRAVNHSHLLSRLIGTIGAPTHYPMSSYLNVVDARAIPVSKVLRLTSAINYGVIHYGVFGAPDDPEIIIATEEPFNIFEDYNIDDKWMRIESVRCIQHQNSCLTPYLLNGTRTNSSVGLRVYQVDIRKLMIQFKYFTEQQMRNSINTGSTLDKTHFIAKYVLPNMMCSDMDLQFINRFQNLVVGRPMDRGHDRLSIPYIDYTDKVDKAFEQTVKFLINSRTSYERYLRSIPVLFRDNAQRALQLPNLPPMRQVRWALLASRVKQMRTLLELGGSEGRKSNQKLINEIRLEFKHVINDKQFSTVLDRYYSSMNLESVFDELMRDIKYIGIAR